MNPPLHRRPEALALVATGGALGASARLGVATLIGTTRWPWATLTVNVIGAFVLGLLLEHLTRAGAENDARRRLRLVAGTGFCGAFTTYSTFAHDVVDLASRPSGSSWAAAGWGAGHVIAGVIAAGLGAFASGALPRVRQQKPAAAAEPDLRGERR